MEIAFALGTHTIDFDLLKDTADSLLTYGSDKVLAVVEGSVWPDYKKVDLPIYKMEGFKHNSRKAPYRNVALGLKTLQETWPNSDWYCYSEYDILFGSDRFKSNLRLADDRGVWMLGNDGHIDEHPLPLIQAMLGQSLKGSYYLLGCCQFFAKKFMDKLKEMDFFDRFLNLTSNFSDGDFPFYSGYDLSEHMYPSLCRHFGGNVGVFASWDGPLKKWHGSSSLFPMRWKPEIEDLEEFRNASILHPIKKHDHPLRLHYRGKREQWKALQKKESQSDSFSICP